MMKMYIKTNPEISFIKFIKLVTPVASFKSLTGKEYLVTSLNDYTMQLVRKSSGTPWSMDLEQVLKAYQELTEFKTENFRSYVPRTHSPALGLLLHLELLQPHSSRLIK